MTSETGRPQLSSMLAKDPVLVTSLESSKFTEYEDDASLSQAQADQSGQPTIVPCTSCTVPCKMFMLH